MQQIADWLEKLGLGQYAQRFAENDISFSVLPDLTDQDLKEIGVSLGHRRQLLRAISELTGREKDAPKAAVATAPSAAPQDAADACGFEGCPACVTNSISPLSYRTLRPWRSVPSGHPMRPSSRREPEYPRLDQATTNSQNRLQVSPPVQSRQSPTKTATFSTASVIQRRRRLPRPCPLCSQPETSTEHFPTSETCPLADIDRDCLAARHRHRSRPGRGGARQSGRGLSRLTSPALSHRYALATRTA